MCFVGSKHWNLLALFIVLRIVKYFGVASENCYQNDGYKGVYRGYRHHRHRARGGSGFLRERVGAGSSDMDIEDSKENPNRKKKCNCDI